MTIKPDAFYVYDRTLELAALDRAWERYEAGAQKLPMYGVFGGTARYHAFVDTSQPLSEYPSEFSRGEYQGWTYSRETELFARSIPSAFGFWDSPQAH